MKHQPPQDSEVWDAYASTDYQVHVDAAVLSIRIGEISQLLDRLLATFGAEEWAFITAHNPASQVIDNAQNEQRHRQLLHEVARRGYQYLTGRGVGADPAWQPEESLFIVGMPRSEAIQLGRMFGQNAVVCGQLGEPAKLVDCRPRC